MVDPLIHDGREEGIKGFWKGLSASYWGCSEGCIQFVVYEKLKKQLIERCVRGVTAPSTYITYTYTTLTTESTYSNNESRRARGLADSEELPPAYTLGAAAFSKFLATTATYPHEVVRTRCVRACEC